MLDLNKRPLSWSLCKNKQHTGRKKAGGGLGAEHGAWSIYEAGQSKARNNKLSSIFIISATTTPSDSKQKQKKKKRRRIDKQKLVKKVGRGRGGMAGILINFLSGFQGYFTIFIKFNAICETGIEQRAVQLRLSQSPPPCFTSIKCEQIMQTVYIRVYMYVC